MGNKGQSGIMYMVITVAMAFVIASGVFLFTRTFKDNVNEDIAEVGLASISQQVEAALLELKQIADTTATNSTNLTIKIPERIGEQPYFITGTNTTTIELRIKGSP